MHKENKPLGFLSEIIESPRLKALSLLTLLSPMIFHGLYFDRYGASSFIFPEFSRGSVRNALEVPVYMLLNRIVFGSKIP